MGLPSYEHQLYPNLILIVVILPSDINPCLIQVINPATEEIIGEAPRGTPQDAASAVEAARLAFPEWRDTPAIQRAAALRSVAGSIRAHHNELVRLLTMEEGKPLPENEEEVWWTEETFDDI